MFHASSDHFTCHYDSAKLRIHRDYLTQRSLLERRDNARTVFLPVSRKEGKRKIRELYIVGYMGIHASILSHKQAVVKYNVVSEK